MQLVQLMYVSKTKKTLSDDELVDLQQVAQRNNERDNITGVLLTTTDYFMQCVEGDAYHINQLYKKIIEDERHHNVTLVDYHLIARRYFSDWALAVVAPSESDKLIDSTLNHQIYNPFEMNSIDCLTLLLAIKTKNKDQSLRVIL